MRREDGPGPIREWHHLAPIDRARAWADLVDWVIWLHDRYELGHEGRLPRCWPQHPGLVEELHALKVWREEIYGTPHVTRPQPVDQHGQGETNELVPGAAEPEPELGSGGSARNGQAARYWHAELRLVVHAATTIYAAGCRAGHRTAPTLTQDAGSDLLEEGGLDDWRHRWLEADPLAGVTPPVREEERALEVLPDAVVRRAIADGDARPMGDLVQEYVSYEGSWWTLAADPDEPAGPAVPSAVAGETRSLGAARWWRVTDPARIRELDGAARRIRAVDDLATRDRERRSGAGDRTRPDGGGAHPDASGEGR